MADDTYSTISPGPMVARNPFEKAFNPDQGGWAGFIGGLAGVPTGSELQGQARGGAAADLSRIQAEQNLSPQQTILEYLKTPQGQQAFVRDPNLMQTIKEWGAMAQKPAGQVVKPGEAIVNQDARTGNVSEVYRNPDQAQQNFSYFSQIAKLPPEQLQELAQLQMTPSESRPKAQERAIQKLIDNKQITPEVGQKIIGGVLQIKPLKNDLDEEVGLAIVDMSTNEVRPIVGTGPAARAQGSTVTPDTAPKNPDGSINPTKTYPNDKRTMFLGSGVAPNVLSTLNTIMRQVDPSAGSALGQESSNRQGYLNNLQNAVINLRDNAAGLSIPKITIDKALQLAPHGGWIEDPKDSVQKGMRLLELAQGEIAAAEDTRKDPAVSKDQRVAADKRIQGWRRIERALPPMEDMQQLSAALDNGTAGAINPRMAIKAVKEGAGKVATDVGGVAKEETGVTIPGTGAKDIMTMKPVELGKLDPAKLTPEDRIKLNNRLNQLLGPAKKKPAGQAAPAPGNDVGL